MPILSSCSTLGGLLSPDDFEIFSLHYMRQIVHALNDEVPTIIFAKGGDLSGNSEYRCCCIGLDWCIRPETREMAGKGGFAGEF